MPVEALIAIIGIPTALTGLFLRHISEQRKEDRKERTADRLLWENHLSGTVKVLTNLVDEVRELRREIKR